MNKKKMTEGNEKKNKKKKKKKKTGVLEVLTGGQLNSQGVRLCKFLNICLRFEISFTSIFRVKQ